MQRAELIIVVAILVIGAAAFGLERLGPDAVRFIAITLCSLLILMMGVGLVVRVRMKRRRDEAAAAEGTDGTLVPDGPDVVSEAVVRE